MASNRLLESKIRRIVRKVLKEDDDKFNKIEYELEKVKAKPNRWWHISWKNDDRQKREKRCKFVEWSKDKSGFVIITWEDEDGNEFDTYEHEGEMVISGNAYPISIY